MKVRSTSSYIYRTDAVSLAIATTCGSSAAWRCIMTCTVADLAVAFGRRACDLILTTQPELADRLTDYIRCST